MSATTKLCISLLAIFLAIIGFLIKIPVPLRGHDKLLHTSFYIGAAAFFHLLYRKRLWIILILLAIFGVLIEYMQQLANKFTRSHIHGRFDIEDVYANCKGLGYYLCFVLVLTVIHKTYLFFQTNPTKK
ncbi:MAG: hypothetical protein KGO92_13555 [Bacteroidota bacterium]|nr:hypothetical protein [Bacteroidota bacterium]